MRRSVIYPYPAVQYIPLSLQVLYHKEAVKTEPFILIGAEIGQNLPQLSQKYALNLPPLPKHGNKLLILAGGLHFRTAKYRGYYATIIGARDSSISLYQLPAQYFYKDTVVFEVKDEEGRVIISRIIHFDLKKAKPLMSIGSEDK
ncbi:MAG TPA: hypothetical protein VIL66_07030 [Bacillota bacterium]